MLRCTIKDLLASMPALARLNQNTDLPVGLSFKLVPVSKRADEQIAAFNQTRLQILEAYQEAAKESAGDDEASKAATDTFNKKLEALLESEAEMEGTKIPFSQLPDDLKMSAQDLNMLSWLIDLTTTPKEANNE